MGTDQNQNVEWSELERSNPDSPLYGWNAGVIKESLSNLTRGKACAVAQGAFPLTLRDVKAQVRHLVPFLNRIHSLSTTTDVGPFRAP